MNATYEFIPAEFSPETEFTIPLFETDEPRTGKHPNKNSRRLLPEAYGFTRRGIPESALND